MKPAVYKSLGLLLCGAAYFFAGQLKAYIYCCRQSPRRWPQPSKCGIALHYIALHCRSGEAASTGLTEALVSLGFETGRLKTGTPARVDRRTVDFSTLEVQPGVYTC